MKRRRESQNARAGDKAAAATYYALNSAPAYHMFGAPDFRDATGREYRVAFAPTDASGTGDPHTAASRELVALRASRNDAGALALPEATADDLLAHYAVRSVAVAHVDGSHGNTVRLWVRLPKRKRGARLPWPKSGTEMELTLQNHDLPVSGDADIVQRVSVAHSLISRGEKATGYVDVDDLPPALCDALLQRQMRRYTAKTNV